MSTAHLSECGIPGINGIPYGAHLCHFYDSRHELVHALVPYLVAGLRNNERCIWVTAPPLHVAEAEAELAKALPGLDAMLAAGRLRILDFSDWYVGAQGLKGNDVARLWLEEEQAALAGGYAGLRITGNTSFLAAGDWQLFMEYERTINHAFQSRNIITLCSYALQLCGAAGVLDVVQSHQCTLHRTDASWQVLTGPGRI